MNDDNRLCCDNCFVLNTEVPIIEKPKRFGYRRIIHLEQNNEDDRAVDNICLDCLKEEVTRKIDWL